LRKSLSILLVLMLLFNWFGYRVMNALLGNHADALLELKLDSGYYDRADLLSIKVPVTHILYYSSSASFERMNGRIEIDGISYSFVKIRLLKDSLELLCIRNDSRSELQEADNNIFRLLNGLEFNGNTKKGAAQIGPLKFLAAEYYPQRTLTFLERISRPITKEQDHFLVIHSWHFGPPIDIPPERA
jgi:hypothetical protein